MEIKKASQSVKIIVVKKLLDLDPTLLSPPRIPSSRPASPVTAAERVAQQEQAMTDEILAIMKEEGLDPNDPAVRSHTFLSVSIPFFRLFFYIPLNPCLSFIRITNIFFVL